MLINYNVMDCGPFVEAVGKMLQSCLAQGIDIFKSSFSVSGVAKIQMLQRCEKEVFFCLFPKRHADLYHTSRSNITGGLSIVFTRLAIKDETKICPHEIFNPETSSSFGGASLPRQMEGPRPRIYPFTTLATKLLGSDADCKGLQPASCFVIQNH